MARELMLPIGERAALHLKRTPAEDWVPSVVWEATLALPDEAQPLGGATITQCRQGLLRLLRPEELKFFPPSGQYPEFANVMSFYDLQGMSTRLFAIRRENDRLELGWDETRKRVFHRTGVIIDPACVLTWPALLESGAVPRERIPPSTS